MLPQCSLLCVVLNISTAPRVVGVFGFMPGKPLNVTA